MNKDKAPRSFFEGKLENSSSEVLLEIIETAIKMDKKTKSIFLYILKEGEIELVKKRLAGWLTLNQEE